MRDMRKDSDNRFLVNLAIYAEVAAIAALVGVFLVAMVATNYLWLASYVAVPLSIFLVVIMLGVYWLLAEDE